MMMTQTIAADIDLSDVAAPLPERIVRVSLLDRRVTLGDRDMLLTKRELAIVAALALDRQPGSATRLLDIIYGDGAPPSGEVAVKVHIHRVRRKLGYTTILRDRDGYRLGDHVRVDLVEMEAKIIAARGRFETLSKLQLLDLAEIADRLRTRRTQPLFESAYFSSIEARLAMMGFDLAIEVGEHLLQRGDAAQAADIARTLLADDPCCEQACELAIKALQHLGKTAAAVDQFRRYRTAVRTEFGAEPSPIMNELFTTSAVS
jgi:DNA-binding SARP family transcriptional activator